MRVCIGGTFNIIHKGHRRLIAEAVSIAGDEGFLFIGLAVDKLVAHKKNVRSFSQRKDGIIDFIQNQKYSPMVVIEAITNRFGPTLNLDFDVIVVSAETIDTARLINKKRKQLGKKPMKIVQIPMILAEDNKPISSTRIRNGEITEDGKIVSRENR